MRLAEATARDEDLRVVVGPVARAGDAHAGAVEIPFDVLAVMRAAEPAVDRDRHGASPGIIVQRDVLGDLRKVVAALRLFHAIVESVVAERHAPLGHLAAVVAGDTGERRIGNQRAQMTADPVRVYLAHDRLLEVAVIRRGGCRRRSGAARAREHQYRTEKWAHV